MTQAYNLRAKVGDQWKTVGNIKPKDGRPGYSIGLTADFAQLLLAHKDGWLNIDALPSDREQSQSGGYGGYGQ